MEIIQNPRFLIICIIYVLKSIYNYFIQMVRML